MRILNTMLDKNWTEPLPIYAWVIEHPEGLIVVDTGETAETAQPGYFPSWHPYWKNVREWVREEEEIGPRMRAIGLSPDDVRWVIMTHLHPDHAGGMFHFPKAHFLISPAEYRLASGFSGQMRGYLPQHFPTWLNPDLVAHNHAPVGPFSESFQLTRAADVFIVPTVGHSGGHQSVVLFDNEEVFFLAGDTSYTQQLMLDQRIDGVSPQEQSAHETLSRILAYARQVPLVYLPSHDPESAKRLSNRQPVFPPVIKQLAAVPV